MASLDRLSIGTINDSLPLAEPNCDASNNIDSPRNNVFFRQSGVKTVVVGLRFPCSLYFQGILEVNVLCGSAVINGYRASAGDRRLPLRVFSTKETSAYSIVATNSEVFSQDLNKFHSQIQPMIRDLLNRIGPSGGCVLCLSPRTSEYAHWKKAFRMHHLDFFPGLTNPRGAALMRGPETLLDCILDIKDGPEIARKLVMSEELVRLSDDLISQSPPDDKTRLLLCGGKGVGKSSYLKYLINRSLCNENSVLYIDLDIGQPEFTLGGCVSVVEVDRPLIGPNYTHSRTPIMSYFVGDVSPVQCLNAYLVAVEKLARFCHSDDRCRNLPWFINTMGMTKSLGTDFIALAVSSFKPHHVVQLNSCKPQDNFSRKLTSSFMRQFVSNLPIPSMENVTYIHHHVESVAKYQVQSFPVPSAVKRREVVAVEFLSSLFNNHDGVEFEPRELPDHLKPVAVQSGILHGDLVALCQKNDNALRLVAYGVIVKQPAISVFSLVDDSTFSIVDAVEKVPVKLKGTAVLDFLPNRGGVVPNVCSFDTDYLANAKKEVLKALFGLSQHS